MNDDVQAGGASTAEAPQEIVSMKDMSETELSAYLKDGTVPTRGKSAEGSSKEEKKETKSDAAGDKPADESGAASDAAGKDTKDQEPKGDKKDQEPPKRESRAERRIRKLAEENKALRAQLEANPGEPKPPDPKAAAKAADDKSQAPKKPRLKDFTDRIGQKDGPPDWETAQEQFDDAKDAYNEELRKIAVKEALDAERNRTESEKQRAEQEKQTNKNAKAFADRAAEFRKTLKEDTFPQMFVEVKEAIEDVAKQNPEMGQIGDVIVESDLGPELVNYFASNPDELDALLEMPLRRALREIGKLEASDKLKAPAPKTITTAKRGTTTVSGAHAVAEDAIEAAIQKNNIAAYMDEANKREKAGPQTYGW